MDQITSLRVFLEVTRRKSFSGAAEHFGISPAAVTKHVAALEKSLNARLLNRTTKQMSLTRAGIQVVDSATSVLQGLEDMREAVADVSRDLSGVVRVGAAPYFGSQRLVPAIAAFNERYPGIQVSLTLMSHHKVEEFVIEGLDVGVINSPALRDATHSAYTLADMAQVMVASPKFLRGLKSPLTSLDDLVSCNCLVNTYKSPTGTWRFTGPDGPVSIRVKGPLRSNYGDALKEAAVHGMGVSVHPVYMVAEELGSGKLEVVLPQYTPELLRVFAIYSARTVVPLRVRAFLEFMREWAEGHPGWPNGPM